MLKFALPKRLSMMSKEQQKKILLLNAATIFKWNCNKWKKDEKFLSTHAHNFYYLPFHVSHHHHNIISSFSYLILSFHTKLLLFLLFFTITSVLYISVAKNVANVQTNKYACDTFSKWIKSNDCVTLFR